MPRSGKSAIISKPVNIKDVQTKFPLHINTLYQYFNFSLSEYSLLNES
jgi:hypothetical protein